MLRRTIFLFIALGCSGTDSSGDPPDTASAPDDSGVDVTPDGGDPLDTNTDSGTDTMVTPPSEECPVPPGATGVKLPVAKIDTTWVAPAGKTITVASGGDFQKALTDAAPGDEIVLEAGATFEGNFKLPNKSGDKWIVIRSSALDKLPARARVTPSMAANMPKLVTKAAIPVITTESGAHHYRFAGIEMKPAAGVDVNDLVALGSGSETDASKLAHHIIIDRSFIHGDPAKGGKRGVQLNSAHTAVIDSWLSDWKRVGQDTQALLGWNGPGPFKIVNNYLEGAGENVMFGGADPKIVDLIPSDIEICRNHFFKPLSWKEGDPSYAGTHWSVKNSFELKIARRVLVSGNVFDQCWADAQTGFAIVLKTANQDGSSPWAITEEVTFAYNHVRKANNGMAISPRDTDTSKKSRSFRVYGNLFTEIGDDLWGGAGRLFQQLGVEGVSYEHNTGFARSHTMMFDGGTNAQFVFRDNVVTKGEYGIFGSGKGQGTAALEAFAAGYVFTGNVVVGATESGYPTGNFFPKTVADVGFSSTTDYALKSDSPYVKKASDGTNPGADLAALTKATAGVIVAP
jgi:hypothetical protein